VNSRSLLLHSDTFKWEFTENTVRGDYDETVFSYTYGKDFVHNNKIKFATRTNQFDEVFTRTGYDPENFDENKELMHQTLDSLIFEDCLDTITLHQNRKISLVENNGKEALIIGYKYFKIDKERSVVQGIFIFNQSFKRYEPLTIIELEKGEILIITDLFYQEEINLAGKILKMNLVVKQSLISISN
jgi:hypothetical protein